MKIELDVQAELARCLAALYLDLSELGRPLICNSDGGGPPGAKMRHTFALRVGTTSQRDYQAYIQEN